MFEGVELLGAVDLQSRSSKACRPAGLDSHFRCRSLPADRGIGAPTNRFPVGLLPPLETAASVALQSLALVGVYLLVYLLRRFEVTRVGRP
ncbi:hypothetical protein BRC62_05630 [Halobacteriales archaeon QH_10_67_13]|nr:MAG: hypothetical protein BRC62_05630 [Halobacteriales archaeon QH_10_67_13]